MRWTPEKVTWNDPRLTKFLIQLARTGNVAAACRKAGIARSVVYFWHDTDEIFRRTWDEAKLIAKEALEEEARRRAETGVLEPVFQGGVRVGTVRKYSDTLLIFLLKALDPKTYRERSSMELTGKDGGPIETKSTATVTVYLPDNGRGDRD